MRAAKGYCQILQEMLAGRIDAEASELLDRAVDAARRLRTMLNGILAMSRVVTHGKPPEPIAAAVPLEQALANLRAELAETSSTATHDPLPVVLADASQLTRVFQELITNAVTFRGAAPPRIHVAATSRDDVWEFQERDNGIGIAAKDAERIFAIFQRLQLQEEAPGIGVGLAIAKRIVERHGGAMWVDSAPGTGSTFLFTLPSADRHSL
jgi:light-regulated signal transduction histidine kinase (bacteriophytochrome)